MDENHFMLISLEDSKSKAISEVLGSKTCKKIIAYLSERKEASQKDLSDALNIPMNTLDYNIKKLVESGFVQKKKEFFWSKKGKKIIMYELSNKSIIISPKKSTSQKFKSIIPAFILTAAGTFAVWAYEKIKYATNYTQEIIQQPVMDCVERNSHELLSPESWFLAGALLVILIFSIVNWKKI